MYYRTYDGHEEDEPVLKFWQQTIFEYQGTVQYKFTFKLEDLMQKFTLFDRIPCGLPNIVYELTERGTMATKEQIMNGSLYKKEDEESGKSLMRQLATGLYNKTFGSLYSSIFAKQEEDDEDEQKQSELYNNEYVCVEFLDRQADIL